MNRLIIIGASGHGRVVADIAALNGYKEIAFLDDNEEVKECSGYPVIGKCNEAPDGDVFVAIGNNQARRKWLEFYSERNLPVLIHPSAVVAKGVTIGQGSAVMAGSIINPGAKIGRGVVVNTCSSVDHDCVIGNYVHVAVGAHICGTVSVGEETWVGAGATIINNLNICGKCMIGAGALVVKSIDEPGLYVGVPARNR